MSEELVWSEIGFGKLETYVKLDKLGKGTYATIYKGRSKLTKKLVALKEIRLEHEEGAPCTAIWKVSLLEDLKHANIVTLRYIIHTERTLTLVFEYLFTSSLGGSALFLVEYLEGLFLHQEFSSTAEGARGWAESDLTAL